MPWQPMVGHALARAIDSASCLTSRRACTFGPITDGEIGVVKKEIVFSSDVLNTTARIEERCNAHAVDPLVSGDALGRPDWDVSRVPVEEIELGGRAVPVTRFTVDEPRVDAGVQGRAVH